VLTQIRLHLGLDGMPAMMLPVMDDDTTENDGNGDDKSDDDTFTHPWPLAGIILGISEPVRNS
jgi:hypothetical protein